MSRSTPAIGPFPAQGVPPEAISVARMQRIDRIAIEVFHIPRLLLMEHAGFAVAKVVRERFPLSRGPVVICCGSGYNGGDGLAATRHLLTWDYQARVILVGQRDRLREEPAIYAEILRQMQTDVIEVTGVAGRSRCEQRVKESGVIIDALLGIGVTGTVREPTAALIQLINASGRPVVAADLPSGLDGDTGAVQGVAVRASITVAFGAPKRGCFTGEGPRYAGEVLVDPIGLPTGVLEGA